MAFVHTRRVAPLFEVDRTSESLFSVLRLKPPAPPRKEPPAARTRKEDLVEDSWEGCQLKSAPRHPLISHA